MDWLLVTALATLPGMKPAKLCPRPILVNIDLNHKIDRGVFKRTFLKCRRQYKKSPCLVKLMQSQKGAFQAICGEPQTGLKNGLKIIPLTPEEINEQAFMPNCSSEIFASLQLSPVIPNTQIDFCPSIEMRSESLE